MVCNRYMSERNVHNDNLNEFRRLIHIDKIEKIDKNRNKSNEFINLNTSQGLGSCLNNSTDTDLINNMNRNISLTQLKMPDNNMKMN